MNTEAKSVGSAGVQTLTVVPRRIAITSSAPASGKTTLGRAVATRLDVPLVEADTLAWEGDSEVPPTCSVTDWRPWSASRPG